MIDLAHSLHMKVIAEDVEKIEIQNKLEQLGIDFSQGYLIGKPIDAVNFEQNLG
jgi:EAL domain-containing protein (putative c-di-GMP-specific phosphodiesterase class I)